MNGFPWVAVPFGEERPAIEAAVPCTGLCVCLCVCGCVCARGPRRDSESRRRVVGRNESVSRFGVVTVEGSTCLRAALPLCEFLRVALPLYLFVARCSPSHCFCALLSLFFFLRFALPLSPSISLSPSPVEGAAQCCVLHAKDELAAHFTTLPNHPPSSSLLLLLLLLLLSRGSTASSFHHATTMAREALNIFPTVRLMTSNRFHWLREVTTNSSPATALSNPCPPPLSPHLSLADTLRQA
jgi:hypothetical protein